VSQYVVACFTYIPGYGWVNKPYAAPGGGGYYPYVNIDPNGTWTASIANGGIDPLSQGIAVAIYPKSVTIPSVNVSLPPPSSGYLAMVYQPRYLGTIINWSGYDWVVKTSCTSELPTNWAGYPVGPNGNYFTDDPNYVWKDGNNKIHIKLQKNPYDGNFYGGELTTKNTFGYGQFVMETANHVNDLPANVTMGTLFTWSDLGNGTIGCPNKETDLAEYSTWNNTKTTIGQDVQQPSGTSGNLHPFSAPNDTLVNVMDWEATYIDFTIMTKSGVLVDHWRYTGPDIPAPGDVHIHMNGWYNSAPSANQAPTELIFNSFAYTSSTWKGGTTNWDTAANWNSGVVPNGAGTTVSFGNQPSGSGVDLYANKIVGNINLFSTTSTSINSLLGDSLTLDNNGSPSEITFVGNHTISVPVMINNDVVISGDGSLTMSTVTGHHALSITNGNLYATSITIDTLTIGNGCTVTLLPIGTLGSSGISAVPEPSMWILIGIGTLVCVWRKAYHDQVHLW
jgi:hypothetical protein